MAEIILHPSHPDYCNECVYHDSEFGNCLNKDLEVWHGRKD